MILTAKSGGNDDNVPRDHNAVAIQRLFIVEF